ncbi:CidA/LrgA family protein [Kribbia dieselivorans]|uniref:CidA/LrgA family protein n=1 Tax=Kribbia dieselivorans TaxID=331526 RepID=UPI0009F8A61F|nr:CidA/LrgA family protein [Kribbia dieselivorans]
MIVGLLVLLLCQLAGELLSRALDLPVPGPVIGMLLLLLVLFVRGERGLPQVERAAEGVLDELPLLFIPAGVGVIGYLGLIRDQWLPVVGGMVGGWAAGLVVTALSAALVVRLQRRRLVAPSGMAEQAGELARDAERMDGYDPEAERR